MLVLLLTLGLGDSDSLLKHEFCQTYYLGSGDCAALRSQVVANHSRALPTLELGDPSKPVMLFFHGWPDTSALWANQFEYFCAGEGKYFCVAPSWIDFHPDVPSAPPSELYYDKQVDAFHAVVAELGLSNITAVIFDFGAAIGYQFLWKYSHLVSRVIAMDVGNGGPTSESGLPGRDVIPQSFSSLLQYQQTNVRAFETHNNTMMHQNAAISPCARCAAITANWGWPYFILQYNVTGDTWPERLAPTLTRAQWKYYIAPDFPDHVPLLFMYGKCEIGTGWPGGKPCEPRKVFFFDQHFTDWVTGRGVGSQIVAIDDAGHWTQCKNPAATNGNISAWIHSLDAGGALARGSTQRSPPLASPSGAPKRDPRGLGCMYGCAA